LLPTPLTGQAASGELRAGIDGSGGGEGVAYETRGYKAGQWADKWAGRRASRRPKSSQKRDFGSCGAFSSGWLTVHSCGIDNSALQTGTDKL